jgi:TonB-linked SusC/RagA family outer membrane protein
MRKKLKLAVPPVLSKLLLSLSLILFFSVAAMAQTVTGTVTDGANKPIAGVTVTVKGTNRATVTNNTGNFSINAGGTDVLVLSSVGFTTQEVPVNRRTNFTINLATGAAQNLDEVVVTALGIRRESKKLGYSATSVNTDELVKNRTTNVGEALEGRVAGLNITPPAAGAGSSNQIRLRGQVGFAGTDNAPLLVINGIPLDQDTREANGAGQMRDRGDNLNNINPDDIESMTVLKGATAAALYGVRAARGAIIITTKSGQRNQGIGVDFTSSYTASEALSFIDEIRQYEYGLGLLGVKPTTLGQAQEGQNGWGAKLDGSPAMNYDGEMRPYSNYGDGLFQFLRTGSNITNTIGLSGGGANGSFRASISTTGAKGIVPNNEYKRRIFNVGINHNITKKLKLQLNVNYADEDYINPPQIGTQGDGPINFFNRIAVSVPVEVYREHAINPATQAEWKTNSFASSNGGTINNPYVPLQTGQRWQEDRNRLLGTATIRYDITDWLYAQGRFSYDRLNSFTESNSTNAIGAIVRTNSDGTYRGNYSISHSWATDINADFLVGASKEFGKFSVDASFGGNTLRSQFYNINESANNFTLPDLYTITNGTVKNANPLGFSRSRTNSLYGVAEFGWNEMLYLNVTGRNDWFSVLNPANNSKFYPSVSGSFIFSELLKNQTWLSYGKLRASWAQVGGIAGIGPFEGVLTYNINANQFNGQSLASISGGNAPNPLIQPFTVEEKEIGLELRMFERKLHLDIAAFDKITTDQIIDLQLSTTSGYSNSKENRASLKNSGLETLAEYKVIENKNFGWTTTWNNTYLKTEVLDVGNSTGTRLLLYFNGTGNEFLGEIRYTEGLAMNQLYTKHYNRNAKGELLLVETGNAKGRLTNDTKSGPLGTGFYPVGSSIPKFTGGWNNTFNYKNLTLGVLIDYKFGGTVLSSTLLNMTRQGLSKLSLEGRETGILLPGVYQNSGLPNTTTITATDPKSNLANYWADYRNYQIGDPFTFKSDFIKLRNVSLAYNFTNVLKKVAVMNFVKGLTLSASVRNVAIIHKDLPGLDPEAIQSSGDIRSGYENSSLPTTRNYNVTLNVKF